MGIMSLWMPIIASAVLVWIVSAIVWMVMPWHKKDWSAVPNESGARAALKGLASGMYMLPYCTDPKQLDDPEVRKKYEEGPIAWITVAPNGLPKMGGKLLLSFVFYLLVGVVCAYILTRTGTALDDYLQVFRVAGTIAFISYSFAYVQESTWFQRPWSVTARNFLDALIYALLTGGVFGWLA
ncbi:hypothetical protein [Woeseia oceani]|uniref:Uncharacterized protein n=1 Tax=Woeseia oceani TaxID=1548547 RepID=A0A193LFZ5_9GAMM|nr:hypothetical protein [Woeseia oceani]ANO51388.1 hypothetical protein BA177_09415 [Woeseia oceani]